jgi:hypothetical protein
MEKIITHSMILETLKKHNMQTNLKDALKSADTIKSPLGDVACYSFNFAELAQEVNVLLTDDGKKVKLTWREYVKLAQIIWDKIKETSRECAGKEIEVKLPPKLSLVAAGFSLIGFKL